MFPFQFNTELFNQGTTTTHPIGLIPEYIEVKTAAGQTVAFLSPDSDGLRECWIDIELNGLCTLTFELPMTSEKWAEITPDCLIIAGGREFVMLKPGNTLEVSREGQKLWGKVMAEESWGLLNKQFVTVSNDPQNPSPPWSVVKILSGGAPYAGCSAGSAMSALSYLLQSTGWTVGTVDVGGIYDLETEKEHLLAVINKLQELWGGFIVWDSLNKTVSLRSESTWLNYTGFQIRYAKNLKSITRIDDYDIVTRLFPFGADDLNISSVNGGQLYIENYGYTGAIYEGVWINQDISNAQQLKDAAIEYQAKVSKPRHNYKTKMLDLRTISGYEHETFDIGHLVDIIDEGLGIDDRVRIIRYKYNVFRPWNCELDVGDPIEKIAASIASTIKASNFVKANKSNTSFQNILKAIINTAATEINGASGDYTCIDGVSTWAERVNGVLTGKLTRATPAGLIISSDGGQTWQTAISGAGIHADAAWVGKIAAGVLQIGSASTFEDGYNPSTKKRVFTVQPAPPYDIGDIWAGGPSGDLLSCKTAKTSGQSYAIADWEKAGKYFDQPGYVTADADGIKVYDNLGALRVLVGSWLKDMVRKYGIKIIDGEIYASIFKTGNEADTSSYVQIGEENNYGYVRLVGTSGKTLEFNSSADQGKVAIFDDGLLKGELLINGATTKEILLWGKNGAGINISAYNGEYITLGSASGVTKNGICMNGIGSDLNPYTSEANNLGASNRKWWTVYSKYLNTGDLNFIEKECAICGGKFEDGDILVLLVKTINEEGYTMTVPIHDRCKHIPKTITLMIPVHEIQYELNTQGELQPLLVQACDEEAEDILRPHPNCELDPKTGKFKRKYTEENLNMYTPEELEKGIHVSKRAALVSDTIVKRIPKCREYTTKINGGDETAT